MIKVRHAHVDDARIFHVLAEACAPLDVHTPYTYWVLARMFPQTCLLALDEGVVVGMALGVPTSWGDLFLWQLGVLPEYRNQGVAAKLLDALASTATLGASRQILTTISPGNDASLAAFQGLAKRLDAGVRRVDEMSVPDPVTGEDHPETMYAIRLEF